MISKLIRAGIGAGALCLSSLAVQAADIPRKAVPFYAPSMSWSGFYVGINGGYGFGNSTMTNAVGVSTDNFNVKGALAGATLGYNFQTGSWVWGAEGDIDYSWMKGSPATACVPCEVRNTWLGTVRGRLGYAGWSSWMPYITGGAAVGDIKITTPIGSGDPIKIGWTVGAGLEWMFMSSWSLKGEYLYVDLGSGTCSAGTCGVPAVGDINASLKAHLVRAGVNYHF